MKLIAQGTLGLSKQIDAGAPADPGDPNAKPPRAPSLARPPRYDAFTILPGTEFETGDYKVSDQDALGLIQSGAVRRKTKEVADDGKGGVQSSPSNPQGPASGATQAPDPNAVADRAMAGENAQARADAENKQQPSGKPGGSSRT